MMRLATLIALAASTALATPAAAMDAPYTGGVHVVPGNAEMARGTVFLDANRNSVLDAGESGIAGVQVSNGREVVLTGADGSYELPAYDDMNLFITKPAGSCRAGRWRHGSRSSTTCTRWPARRTCRFGGIAPTGPLPEAVNFPLVASGAG